MGRGGCRRGPRGGAKPARADGARRVSHLPQLIGSVATSVHAPLHTIPAHGAPPAPVLDVVTAPLALVEAVSVVLVAAPGRRVIDAGASSTAPAVLLSMTIDVHPVGDAVRRAATSTEDVSPVGYAVRCLAFTGVRGRPVSGNPGVVTRARRGKPTEVGCGDWGTGRTNPG